MSINELPQASNSAEAESVQAGQGAGMTEPGIQAMIKDAANSHGQNGNGSKTLLEWIRVFDGDPIALSALEGVMQTPYAHIKVDELIQFFGSDFKKIMIRANFRPEEIECVLARNLEKDIDTTVKSSLPIPGAHRGSGTVPETAMERPIKKRLMGVSPEEKKILRSAPRSSTAGGWSKRTKIPIASILGKMSGSVIRKISVREMHEWFGKQFFYGLRTTTEHPSAKEDIAEIKKRIKSPRSATLERWAEILGVTNKSINSRIGILKPAQGNEWDRVSIALIFGLELFNELLVQNGYRTYHNSALESEIESSDAPTDEKEPNQIQALQDPRFRPTDAPAGSQEKIELLRKRLEEGLPIWHPEDRVDYDGLTGAIRPRSLGD